MGVIEPVKFNPDIPLGRHSGEGRNPAMKNTPQSGQNQNVVPLTWEFVDQLDTGLRRYDAVISEFKSFEDIEERFQTDWIAFRSK